MGQIRPATKEDATTICPNLRDADRREIEASSGFAPSPGLLIDALSVCDRAWALETSDKQVAALLGTSPVFQQPDIGYVWLIGTPLLESNRIEFLKGCKAHLQTVYGPYKLLTNYADERNTLHLRWLRWMGFSFIRRFQTYGTAGLPFLEFVGINPSHV